MAEANQIAELRRLIDEPTADTFTDEALSARIDETGDLRVLAAVIWREKAASLAGLADVREGNSDRKLSQLYKQALEMAGHFEAMGETTVAAAAGRTRTRRIERM